jgi:CRP-like cAMP-binding protein
MDGHLHPILLKRGQTLFRAHEDLHAAFFPESGVISYQVGSKAGEVLQVSIVGRDGLAGSSLVPGANMVPYDGVVQAEGRALRMSAESLKELTRTFGPLRLLLGRYAYSVFASGVQTAVCNNFHPIKDRCARWLLMLHDLADGDTFSVTQNLLAVTLGVRRPSVTVAATALHEARLVQYHHGRLTVRNRRGLEAAACECYRLIRDQQRRLLGY